MTIPSSALIALTILIATFAAAPVRAQASFDLADPDAHILIDILPETERATAVTYLGDQVIAGEILPAAEVLCRMRPWTTGSSQTDDELQAAIWATMAKQPNAETLEFRWLDCAAVSREGWHRTQILDPMTELRLAMCGADSVTPELLAETARLAAASEVFGAAVAAAQFAEGPRSYYPMRSALRAANLSAGLAAMVENTDPNGAREHLRDAVSELEAAADAIAEAGPQSATRNAWRMRSDLRFYTALYGWLAEGGGRDTLPDLTDLLLPVLPDETQAEAISDDLRETIGPDYVDPIFLDRLAPGAALTAGGDEAGLAECAQWRRRSYAPRALIGLWKSCADTWGVVAFDACMAQLEANDWTLAYVTVSNNADRRGVAEDAVRKYISAVAEQMSDDDPALFKRLRDIDVTPIGNNLVTFLAMGPFTTEERARLSPFFDAVDLRGIRPQFRRPRVH